MHGARAEVAPGGHFSGWTMNFEKLGIHFDINGGVSDLIFPHLENEIDQTTSAHDGEYVNFWMHSGMFTGSYTYLTLPHKSTVLFSVFAFSFN